MNIKTKILMSILSLMIGNSALGWCFSIERSETPIKEAWADIEWPGCQDIRLFPGYWHECKNWECAGGCIRPTIKITFEGRPEAYFHVPGGLICGDVKVRQEFGKVYITTKGYEVHVFDITGGNPK